MSQEAQTPPTYKQLCGFLCGGFGTCCICVGTIFLVLGIVTTTQTAGVDAEEDFESIGSCTIQQVIHTEDLRTEYSQSGGSKGSGGTERHCFDVYDYRFSFEGQQYQAAKEELRRDFDGWGDTLCSTSQQKAGSFAMGDVVDCWRRKDVSTELDSVYRCGNLPGCYKIFDPAAEVAAAQGTSTIFMIVGAVGLTLAVLLCCMGCLLMRTKG